MRIALALAVGLTVGCAETSIGVAPCEAADCGMPLDERAPAQVPDRFPEGTIEGVAMRPLTELTPSSSTPLPTPGGTQPGDGAAILTADPDGNLVYFYVQRSNRTLYVIPIDDDGQARETIPVAKPTAWNPYPSPTLYRECPGSACIHESGTTVQVEWIANCDDDDDGACEMREKLYYGADLHAPPLRLDQGEDRDREMFVGADGDHFIVREGLDPTVAKLDADTGDMLWSSGDFAKGTVFDRKPSTLRLGGLPLDDGRFAVLAQPYEFVGGDAPVVLHLIDRDGNVELVNGYQSGAVSHLLAANGNVTYVSTVGGDLQVLFYPDAWHFSGVFFTREDYTLLLAEVVAADPSGNVYIGLHSGSRSEPKPTLCRATPDRTGSCYTLPMEVGMERLQPLRFDDILARDGGEVFIQSGSQLLKFQYPE